MQDLQFGAVMLDRFIVDKSKINVEVEFEGDLPEDLYERLYDTIQDYLSAASNGLQDKLLQAFPSLKVKVTYKQ